MAPVDPLTFRSPFNGGIIAVPPENQSPEFLAALETAGFTREEPTPPTPKPPTKRKETPTHG